jgi:predicted CXXCH cytochrome family protein
VDEKIVYRDRDIFEEPLAQAGNFIGYTDQVAQLTVCGNCHVEKQGEWEETAHADAWETLQGSGHAQAFCEGCHTVNEYGNEETDSLGYNATFEDRYHDVQCESCHGPGLEHVTNPTDLTVPMAPLGVGVDATYGCGECHSGETHHPFVNEWSQSRHGDMNTYPQGRADCESCHTGEGALAVFAPRTVFAEMGDVVDNTSNNLPITCAVCHDPHDATNEGQLRFPVDAPDVEENLCMKCHHKRAIPDLTPGSPGGPGGTYGPHSPQGPLLLGEVGSVGWLPDGFSYSASSIRGTHGSEANERLCAGCHVNTYNVTDAETGAFVFGATGHLFKPIPCLDADGKPTADDSCAYNTTERTWASCTASGCHGDATAALSAYNAAQTRISDLVAELDALLTQVETADPTQIDSNDSTFTIAEGAKFNLELGEITSSAVHNPFMTEALLDASIDAVMDRYGVPQQTNVKLGTIWPQFVPEHD